MFQRVCALFLALLIGVQPVFAGVNSKLLTTEADSSFPNSLVFTPDSTLSVNPSGGIYNIGVGNHSAALLTSGTLNAARLPGNVAFTDATNNFTADQSPNAVNSYDLGTTSKWWRRLYLGDSSSYYTLLDTASLTDNRTVNFPDANSTTVVPDTGASNNFLTAISSSGAISKAQPSFSNLSGTASSGQLPSNVAYTDSANSFTASQTPNAVNSIDLGSSTKWWRYAYLGDSASYYTQLNTAALTANRTVNFPDADSTTVQPSSAVSNQFVTGIGADGVISRAQPSSSNLSDGPFLSNPMTTLGDLIYGGASGTPTRRAGNTTTTPQFLKSLGSGGVATAPAWAQVDFSDLSGTSNVPSLSSSNTFSGNILQPSPGNVYDIGSVTNGWRYFWFGNNGSGGVHRIQGATVTGANTREHNFPNANSTQIQPASSASQFVNGVDSQGVISFGSAPSSGTACDGRLTLTSNTPVTSGDVTAATSVYFCPYKGNKVPHSDGSNVYHNTFSQITISLSGKTANTNQDIFVYDSNADGIDDTGELVQWTNNTTRATSVIYSLGVPVKNGAVTRTFVGTVRITGTTGQCEDSKANRYVWNNFNRVPRTLSSINTATSYTYSTKTWRQFNNGTGSIQLNLVNGLSEDAIITSATAFFSTSNAGRAGYVGIGINSTSTNSAQLTGSNTLNQSTPQSIRADYSGTLSVGLNNIYPLEAGNGSITTTWYGTGNDSFASPGIVATYPM